MREREKRKEQINTSRGGQLSVAWQPSIRACTHDLGLCLKRSSARSFRKQLKSWLHAHVALTVMPQKVVPEYRKKGKAHTEWNR